MIVNGNKELEWLLADFFGVFCSECSEEWFTFDNGWKGIGESKEERIKMAKEFLPKVLADAMI